jgi:hypothetical protein
VTALDHSDAGDDAGTRGYAVIFVEASKLSEFKERRAGVD